MQSDLHFLEVKPLLFSGLLTHINFDDVKDLIGPKKLNQLWSKLSSN